MKKSIKLGQSVRWKWRRGWGEGVVRQQFTQRVVIKINGTEVTRQGTEQEPAYLIKQDDGGEVLKTASELEVTDA
jgi:hypothetical protein